MELEDELLELEPLDELLELELLEVLGFGILPTFLTLMNLPSKSNQKDEPIEIAIALIIQPKRVMKSEETGMKFSNFILRFCCCETSDSPHPNGNDIFSASAFISLIVLSSSLLFPFTILSSARLRSLGNA